MSVLVPKSPKLVTEQEVTIEILRLHEIYARSLRPPQQLENCLRPPCQKHVEEIWRFWSSDLFPDVVSPVQEYWASGQVALRWWCIEFVKVHEYVARGSSE